MMAAFQWRFWPWHRYSHYTVRRMGKLDGEKNIPSWMNPDQPPFVIELVEAAEHDVSLLAQKWHAIDLKLTQEANQARQDRDQARQQADKAGQDLDMANEHYKAAHGVQLPAGTDVRVFWYWALVAVLFLSEYPINAIVFRLFGESEVFTYVATAAIAASLLASAHYLGCLLREGKWDRTRVTLTCVCVLLPIAVIAAVAWLRSVYISRNPQEAQVAWSSGMLFAFATFNLLIFVVAAVASYFVHDPWLLAVYRARKQATKAQERLQRAENRLIRADICRGKTKDMYQAKAHQIKDTVQLLIQAYRTENLRSRTDREQYEQQGSYQPRSFEKQNQPQITVDIGP